MNVQKGEFISLVGASGCGKSTLLRIIAGLLEPSGGGIIFEGRPSGSSASRLGRIGYMPQQDLLLPWRTVLDNCLLAWELQRKGSRQAAVQQIRSLLHSLGLAGTENAYPEELSGACASGLLWPGHCHQGVSCSCLMSLLERWMP